jgi:hypothetical protein
MITVSNQACLAKMTGRRVQEEVIEETIPIRGSYLGIPKTVSRFIEEFIEYMVFKPQVFGPLKTAHALQKSTFSRMVILRRVRNERQ